MAKKKSAEAVPSSPSAPNDDYEIQNHLDTLHRAADIMGDPDKMKKVHKLAGRRHKALKGMLDHTKPQKINSLDDLKKRAYTKRDDEEDME